MMIKRKKLWLAVIIVFIFAAIHLFSKHYFAQEQSAAPIEIAKVIREDAPYILDFSGRTEAFQVVDLTPQVSGQIIKSHFTEGSFVKKDDLLIEIDPRKYQYALDQANAMLSQHQSQLAYAQKELDRYTKLDKNKIVSNEDFEKIRLNRDNLISAIEQDQSNINNAKLMLEYCSIKAPIDGLIGQLNIKVGNFVQAGTPPLARINSISPIYIVFNVDEKVFDEIKNTNDLSKFEILIKTLDNQEIKNSKIAFIDNEINKASGSIKIKSIYQNEEKNLWANQFVKVFLKLKEVKNAIIVPSRAIQMNQKGSFVFVVVNNIAEIRYVTELFTLDDKTIIEQGLEEGEIVVVDGLIRLKNGSLVKIKNEKAGETK